MSVSGYFLSGVSKSLEKLKGVGIEDGFTVKVKDFGWLGKEYENCLGVYRGGSQFKAGGTIFWLNEKIEEVVAGIPGHGDIERVVTETVLHEYGHVIAELVWMRWVNPMRDDPSCTLARMLSEGWPGKYHGRPWDEEEFAEDFAMWVNRGNKRQDLVASMLTKVVERYVRALGR